MNPEVFQSSTPDKNPKERLDFSLLRGIYEKCTKRYEGKYSGPLFGKNVILSEQELAEVERMIEFTKKNIDRNIERDNVKNIWDSFNKLLEEKRKKFGSLLIEEQTVVADDSVNDAIKDRVTIGNTEEIPAIKVPQIIRDCYIRNNVIEALKESIRLYKADLLKGADASEFGENVKKLLSYF